MTNYNELRDGQEFYANGYKKGYEDAKKEFERPQGEWLWLGDSLDPNHRWSCNKCGRGVKEQENYCPTCGAQMKWGYDE